MKYLFSCKTSSLNDNRWIKLEIKVIKQSMEFYLIPDILWHRRWHVATFQVPATVLIQQVDSIEAKVLQRKDDNVKEIALPEGICAT